MKTYSEVKSILIQTLTNYDRKQSTKRGYNHYALGIYFQRVDEVCVDIEKGASPRQALLSGFSDRLLDVCLKAIGEKPYSIDEMHKQTICYTPLSASSVS